jgi:hypothetical protein
VMVYGSCVNLEVWPVSNGFVTREFAIPAVVSSYVVYNRL